MITETFTIKEMEAEISKNYSAIMGALLKYAPQYKKDFTKRRHAFDYPMVYTTTKRVVIKPTSGNCCLQPILVELLHS